MGDESTLLTTEVSRARRVRRRPRWHVRWRRVAAGVAAVALLAAAYALTSTLYFAAQQNGSKGYSKNPSTLNELEAIITITSIEPSQGQLSIQVDPLPRHTLAAAGGLAVTRAVHVQVLGSRGDAEYDWQKGAHINPLNVTIGMSGSQSAYPFDSYRSTLIITASAAAPATTVPQRIPRSAVLTQMYFSTQYNGYQLSITPLANAAPDANTMAVSLVVSRAPVAVVFAVVMLVLEALLAVVAAAAATASVSRRRRVDTALLTWLAALLFAIVPLRNAMPGAPPIGAEMDVLVFFWAVTIICLSLVTCLVTWLREAPARHGG